MTARDSSGKVHLARRLTHYDDGRRRYGAPELVAACSSDSGSLRLTRRPEEVTCRRCSRVAPATA